MEDNLELLLDLQYIRSEFQLSDLRIDSLAFDKYFQDAAQYKRVIPGLSELLELITHTLTKPVQAI